MNKEPGQDDSSAGRHSFVVRIWREEGRPGWKGWVQHARTGECLFVCEVVELLAFIEHHTGKLTERPSKE